MAESLNVGLECLDLDSTPRDVGAIEDWKVIAIIS